MIVARVLAVTVEIDAHRRPLISYRVAFERRARSFAPECQKRYLDGKFPSDSMHTGAEAFACLPIR